MRTWKKLLYSAIPLVVVLAFVELGARFVLGGRIQQITGVVEWKPASWKGLSYFWDQYHPRLGWTNVPAYASDERVPFRVTINGQGLRGERDYAARPAAGVRRFAVFGDSTTFGEEVDDDQTVPFYLEASLKDAEVMNFGVRGYGLGQIALRLEEDGFPFEPNHVIVMLLLPEDIHRDSTSFFTHAKPVFFMGERGLEIGNYPVPSDARLPWLFRNSFAAAWLWGRPAAWPDSIPRSQAVQTAGALLERIQQGCAQRDIAFTLVTTATPYALLRMIDKPAMRQEIDGMRSSLSALELDWLDLIAPLGAAYQARGNALKAPLVHWSAEGNRFIAGRIAAHLMATAARASR